MSNESCYATRVECDLVVTNNNTGVQTVHRCERRQIHKAGYYFVEVAFGIREGVDDGELCIFDLSEDTVAPWTQTNAVNPVLAQSGHHFQPDNTIPSGPIDAFSAEDARALENGGNHSIMLKNDDPAVVVHLVRINNGRWITLPRPIGRTEPGDEEFLCMVTCDQPTLIYVAYNKVRGQDLSGARTVVALFPSCRPDRSTVVEIPGGALP